MVVTKRLFEAEGIQDVGLHYTSQRPPYFILTRGHNITEVKEWIIEAGGRYEALNILVAKSLDIREHSHFT